MTLKPTLFAMFVSAVGLPVVAEAAGKSEPLEINFAFHVELGLAEQDVFIERETGTGLVYRVTSEDLDLTAPLYRTAHPLHHDPFDADALGPYVKGDALNLSLADWYAAEGKAVYECKNGKGRIDATFTGLVPEGIYTMWHFFMASPQTDPFIGTFDLPLGARDGTQSVFSSGPDGSADFTREFEPCLQMSGEQLAAGLAVAWHSDGMTYGPLPGEFATRSHIQLFTVLPAASE